MNKMVIWGASGHAKVVADIIRIRNTYQLVGFIDNINPQRHNTAFCGSYILGGEEQLNQLLEQGVNNLIFGFGDCDARLRLAHLVKSKGFQLATAIHPHSTIASDVIVGAGTVIAAGAVINSGSLIGENAIINTSSSVDHDCAIGDGTHICPGTHLGGQVTIGRGTWIGIGSTIIDHISIGSNTLIGAGAVVVNDIPENVIAYGNPAKIKNNRQREK